MENDIPSDGLTIGGDCFSNVFRRISDRYFSIAPRAERLPPLRAADCDSPEARASAGGERYIPAIFFISFSLFNASMGVSESMSSPLIWSRI